MIPISLQLTNFLSYANGVEPLDFTRFHTACLCGNNGHGKSALLDALTWAMWGKAREDTPGLLRIGAPDMRVEMVFDLDGERYRITRGWAKKKRGGDSTLELNILDAPSGLYRAITRSSVRETQEQLSTLLRMDYDTFIASAYLKQGQADRFTRQPPAQRKQVLAEILGLARYGEIADRAREESRAVAARVAQLEARIDNIEVFLSGRDEAQRLFDHYTALLQTLAPRIEQAEQRAADNAARRVRLEARRERATVVLAETDEAERKRALLQRQRGELLARKHELDEWQAQSETITLNFQKLQQARAEKQKWDDIYATWRALADEAQRLKEAINQAGESLRARQAQLREQCAVQQKIADDNALQVERADEIRQGEEQLQAARRDEAALAQKRAGHDAALHALREAEDALRARRHELDTRAHRLDAQLADLESQAARAVETKKLLDAAEAQIKQLDDANARLHEMQEERNAHDARLQQLKQASEAARAEVAANEQKLKVLQANPQAQCPLCESQLGEHGREHIQENIEDEIAHAQSRIEEYTQEGRLLQKKKAALDAPIAEMQARLRDAPRLHKNSETARLQWETATAAQNKIGALQAEREQLQHLLQSGEFAPDEAAAVRQARAALKAAAYDASAHAALSRRVNELSRFEREIAALNFAQSQITDARQRLALLEPERREVEAQLQRGDFAREETTELARLKAQADRLQYDKEARAAHALARATEQQLAGAEERWHKLQSALSGAERVEADFVANAQDIAAVESLLEKLAHERDSLRDVASQLAACERELSEAAAELKVAREAERDASTQLGAQQNKLEECERQEAERVAVDEERKTAAQQLFILKETATAFGKEGIQALIIENAIPEIQDDANDILRRLTRNHMQVSLESLREKQSGGLRETLDIKISDDRGTREYALFSGGEAFRADFALRIALSKLLARRAGTQLRTLIIDEGFGTQDAEGLQQMIECIQAISDDFDKVLVVTHLDALKNAFPTRIEVSKQPDTGSRYEIVG